MDEKWALLVSCYGYIHTIVIPVFFFFLMKSHFILQFCYKLINFHHGQHSVGPEYESPKSTKPVFQLPKEQPQGVFSKPFGCILQISLCDEVY